MAEIERKDVDSYIETLIDSEFKYGEIKNYLTEKTDLSQSEITDKLKSKFVPAFRKQINRYLLSALILGIVTIACVTFYYYNEHMQNHFMQNQIISGKATSLGNGKYLVNGNFHKYEFIPRIGGWTGLFTIISLIFAGINWGKIRKIKKVASQ